MVSRWKKSVASSPAAWALRNVRQWVSVPRGAGPHACRGQDAADGAGADVVSESGELALDAAVSPSRVLPCQPDDELAGLAVDARAARPVRVGPFSGDQASVPGQECGGGDEAVAAQLGRQDSGQGGQECPIGPGWASWAELPA
jgi:hypothetical protein